MAVTGAGRILKGAGVVTLGQLLGSVFSFLRNMILARLLFPEETAIAFALSTYMMTSETILAIGIERLVIVWDGEDLKRFERVGHTILLLRGLVLVGLMVLFAPYVCQFIHMEEYTESFLSVSLAPLLRSCLNLDVFRQQRRMNFHSLAICEVVPLAISTVVVYYAALWYGDHRAILVALYVRQFLWVVCSHLFSEEKYGLAWSKEYCQQYLVFGIPLLFNGILVAFTQYADRYVVGYTTSQVVFGYYTLAAMFADMPLLVLSSVLTQVGLSWIKEANDDPQRLASRQTGLIQICSLISLATVTGLGMLGAPLLVLLFGKKYAESAALLPMIAIIPCIRLVRTSMSTIAIAHRNSPYCLRMAIIRVILSIVGMAIGVQWEIKGVILGALSGEIGALIWGIVTLPGQVPWTGKRPLAVILLGSGGSILLGFWLVQDGFNLWVTYSVGAIILVILASGIVWLSPELRTQAIRIYQLLQAKYQQKFNRAR
jgi:O-antigen/teichoic acid export membrane protein